MLRWSAPSRLFCEQRLNRKGPPPSVLMDSGTLEQMILQATVVADGRRRDLFIECDGEGRLNWGDIVRLRQSPAFPVEV